LRKRVKALGSLTETAAKAPSISMRAQHPATAENENLMKRFHVHAHVEDLQASIAFYSKMFAAEPTRVESDYAKWMLEDPRINFAISNRGGQPGVDHLGFQTDTVEELAELQARAEAADMTLLDVGETSCCYARSDKHWVVDPQGIAWEHFHTLADIPVFSESNKPDVAAASACCAGAAPRSQPVGIPVKSASSCC
jgi:lactoylglutathione lyase